MRFGCLKQMVSSDMPFENEFENRLSELCVRPISDVFVDSPDRSVHGSKGKVFYYELNRLNEAEFSISQQDFEEILNRINFDEHKCRSHGGIDCAIALAGRRFRLNAFFIDQMIRLVMRPMPTVIPDLTEIGFPTHAWDAISNLRYGLILVCGPTGSGKSTTVASILQRLIRLNPHHLITLEDPVEYIIEANGSGSLISQRELGRDFPTFASGLRMALRERPRYVFVGEIRDAETAETAISAAETGHLIFATLHTGTVEQSINRLVQFFSNDQERIRKNLSMVLKMVVCQSLVPRIDKDGMHAIHQIMLLTKSIQNHISKGNIALINSEIQTGRSNGQQAFCHASQMLYNQGIIDFATAQSFDNI